MDSVAKKKTVSTWFKSLSWGWDYHFYSFFGSSNLPSDNQTWPAGKSMNFMGIYIIIIIIYYNICEQDLSMDDPANHARLPDCSLHHASKDI